MIYSGSGKHAVTASKPLCIKYKLRIGKTEGRGSHETKVAGGWGKGETYVTKSPSNSTFFRNSTGLVGLTFNAKVHDVVSANSTVLCHGGQESAFISLHRYLQ